MNTFFRKTFILAFLFLLLTPFFLSSIKPVYAENPCPAYDEAHAFYEKQYAIYSKAYAKMTPAESKVANANLESYIKAAKDAWAACGNSPSSAPSATSSGAESPAGAATYGLSDPLGISTGGASSIATVISRLIKFLLALSGSVALLMFVWGGFQYLWSAGDENKVKSGKSTLKNAMIGLVIIFSSYMLVTTLITALSM